MAVLRRRRSIIGRLMHLHAAMIVGGMIVRDAFGMRHRHRRRVHMRRGSRLDLIGQARKRRPECEREGRRENAKQIGQDDGCLLYTSPSPRD
ncbi:hypothetical protein PMN64_21890, partial [Bradyrhizobium sp. UFLA01-814]|uniref:hypothetical protein n=1 Tax=Bradyrhizobium sp. UFLA01-814 TaxID=3023480 RepID=UPI00398AA2ED